MRNTVLWGALFTCLLSSYSSLVASEVQTVAGNGKKGTAADGSLAAESSIGEPYGVVIGPDGALYVCEIANHVVRKVDLSTGQMKIVAGSGKVGYAGDGGPATEALLNEPYEVRFDSKGNLLFVEMKNSVIRKVDKASGLISTVAGTGTAGFSGDDGPATKATMKQPHSIALDEADNIYVCDIGNSRVRKIDAETGLISTVIGGGKNAPHPKNASIKNLALKGPRALDYAGNGLFILALREGNTIYRLDLKKGTFNLIAGTGKSGYAGHGGNALLAQLSGPKGVAVATNGDVYFADTESHTVRVIRAQSGIVETVVGYGQRADGPDGNPTTCGTARPHAVCLDTKGNLYIGDSENHRVRVLKVSE